MLPFLVLFRQRAGCVEVASGRVVQPIYRLPVGPRDQVATTMATPTRRVSPGTPGTRNRVRGIEIVLF